MRVHGPVFGRAVIKVNEPITPSRVTYDDASGMTVYDYVFVLVGVLFVHNVHGFHLESLPAAALGQRLESLFSTLEVYSVGDRFDDDLLLTQSIAF